MVFASCNAVFIYPNVSGQITIKQAETPTNDAYISIPIEHVEKVVSALRIAKHEAIKERKNNEVV